MATVDNEVTKALQATMGGPSGNGGAGLMEGNKLEGLLKGVDQATVARELLHSSDKARDMEMRGVFTSFKQRNAWWSLLADAEEFHSERLKEVLLDWLATSLSLSADLVKTGRGRADYLHAVTGHYDPNGRDKAEEGKKKKLPFFRDGEDESK